MVHEIQIYSRIHAKPQSRKSDDLLKIKNKYCEEGIRYQESLL